MPQNPHHFHTGTPPPSSIPSRRSEEVVLYRGSTLQHANKIMKHGLEKNRYVSDSELTAREYQRLYTNWPKKSQQTRVLRIVMDKDEFERTTWPMGEDGHGGHQFLFHHKPKLKSVTILT